MTEEFCLSKKIREYNDLINMNIYPNRGFISAENVKEFIRLLKKEIAEYKKDPDFDFFESNRIENVLDKLAGEKLI